MTVIKTDFPPFRMKIEQGRLCPATQFDAERLDSFSRQKEVLVYVTQETSSKMVRKWWAVIGKAVTECKTPWRNVNQASAALKLALGHCNQFKTIGGEWRAEPKSLTELTDSEMATLFDEAMIILERITGVDPLTLGAAAADTNGQESGDLSSSQEASAGDKPVEDGGAATSSSEESKSDVDPGGSPTPADCEPDTDTDAQASGEDDADPPPAPASSSEDQEEAPIVIYARRLLYTVSCIVSMKNYEPKNQKEAKEAIAPTVSEEQAKLGKIDKKMKEDVTFIHSVCGAILRAEREISSARVAIAATIKCDPDQLIDEREMS